MANTRNRLKDIDSRLDESIGVRTQDSVPKLSPVANLKDVGRRALRDFGSLAIESVIPDPEQPRTEFDADEIGQLANSIRDKGQLHPIRVRWSDQHGKWVIISGERRYRATLKAGLPTIHCHFQNGELSRTEILEQQLIENLLRQDLRPIEEATAFSQLLGLNNWTGKQLAEAIRVNPSKITRSLALLKLPDDVQHQVESGDLSARAAYELTKLPTHEQVHAAIGSKDEQPQRITIVKAQSQVRQRIGKPKPEPRGVRQTFMTEDGWKVLVTSPRRGNYDEMEQALILALEEVRLRIANKVHLL
ncbi:ParB/RepB/Spo0J family partition protein [Novipirellula artificiosorum]|uniref:Chromosome-partitioning protein ParB n=1 Tax=Novipirellula artificiosorum TaxID=2528016 RepID=A0A5C6DF85_9BACT|nr:ParB/RepB/Spo0J family partition protein [Novipirellula artificiosorum]TWU34895.1 Chromosome-partitioning protein ParB [Novipirellula artificiosorum]